MSETRPNVEASPELSLGSQGEYSWTSGGHAHNHQFLLPGLRKSLGAGNGRALIDLGCGNGSLTSVFATSGFRCTGTEISKSGVAHARSTFPNIAFVQHNLEDPLVANLHGAFDVALSAEVIEHLLLPRSLFARATEALKPGGQFVITTPYHGWLKNVALASTNKFDRHWNPGWDYGHVKFFSRSTLTSLAIECGFEVLDFDRVGRIPPLAMSMILVLRKPNK